MLNYWWVTRPKRKLDSVPEVLAAFADLSLNQEWAGQRDSHLEYEEALEVVLRVQMKVEPSKRLRKT